MTEPTIPEMIAWLESTDEFSEQSITNPATVVNAIHAILEQQRRFNRAEPIIAQHLERSEHAIGLEAIRAFVGRVEKRYFAPHDGPQQGYRFYMQKELAALEGEAAANE